MVATYIFPIEGVRGKGGADIGGSSSSGDGSAVVCKVGDCGEVTAVDCSCIWGCICLRIVDESVSDESSAVDYTVAVEPFSRESAAIDGCCAVNVIRRERATVDYGPIEESSTGEGAAVDGAA